MARRTAAIPARVAAGGIEEVRPVRALAGMSATPRLHALSAVLLSLALLAAAVIIWDASRQPFLDDLLPEDAANLVRTPVSFAAHAVELVAITGLGLIGFLRWNRVAPRAVVRWFLLLQAAGLLMALRGLSISELASQRIAGTSGPLLTALSALAFAGMGRAEFRFAARCAEVGCVLLCLCVLHKAGSLGAVSREQAVAVLGRFVNPLYWTAAWVLLRPRRKGLWVAIVCRLPLAVYVFGSFVVQTRLNLVMAGLLVAADMYVAARRERTASAGLARLVPVLVILALASPAVFLSARYSSVLERSIAATTHRLTEDSRSDQLVSFFNDVSPGELVLGRGTGGTWNWPGMSSAWTGGTDVGYLTLLFYGGLPLLLTYLLVHARPAWRVLLTSTDPEDLAPAAIAVLWTCRMFSSELPNFTLDSYFVLFCLGRCFASRALPHPLPPGLAGRWSGWKRHLVTPWGPGSAQAGRRSEIV